ncbi:unnamed protein product [Laminaria digitata]
MANKASFRRQERPASHHGIRCSRCKVGPIAGSCYRCAAGCQSSGGGRSDSNFGRGEGGERSSQSIRGSRSPGKGRGEGEQSSRSSGGSCSSGVGREGGGEARSSSHLAKRVVHSSGGDEGCYTLCEACFSERGRFHPPHPFARLRPGFGDSRLSGPELYEAV